MKPKQQQQNNIVSVVGTTGSGKTAFALKLAEQILHIRSSSGKRVYQGVDLISVDSRQVYMGLEVLTGADIPAGFFQVADDQTVCFPYYLHKQLPIAIHGISIVNPDQEWSVVHFKDFAFQIIENSFQNNRIPLLVGGTGLYHQHLLNSDANLYIPPDRIMREKAALLSVHELQQWLEKLQPDKLKNMNNSDKNNPRRLVRAIEIISGVSQSKVTPSIMEDVKIITFGMEIALQDLQKKVYRRVQERCAGGAIAEVKNILHYCEKKDMPACSTLGIADICAYLHGTVSLEECQNNWALHEFQYAKRQLTWFKKQQDIIWLDDLQKKQYTLNNEKIIF